MALEQWGPLRGRTDVRLAIFTGAISLVLVSAGVVTLVLMRDLNAIGVGLLGLGYTYSVLWPLRERWHAWRRIGAVSLEMADLNIVPGVPSSCAVVVVPRREVVVQEITLVLEYRHSRGGGSTSAWQVDVPCSPTPIRRNEVHIFDTRIVLPHGVPASFFDSTETRQWSVTGMLTLADGARWQREYPVLVYPSP